MSEPQRTPVKATYKAVVHEEAEGGYWAEVPELPGCFTQGETLDALYQNLIEAIACHRTPVLVLSRRMTVRRG